MRSVEVQGHTTWQMMSAQDKKRQWGVVNGFAPHRFWGWAVSGQEGASIPGARRVTKYGRKTVGRSPVNAWRLGGRDIDHRPLDDQA